MEVRSIFENYWAAMFDQLGWEYKHRPAEFGGWQPDFMLYGAKSVYVAVVPVHEYYSPAAAAIDASDCPYECLIVSEGPPGAEVQGSNFLYPIGQMRSRDFRGQWYWHPALLRREGPKVIFRHHWNGLQGLTERPEDVDISGAWLETMWQKAKAAAAGERLVIDAEEFEKEKDFQSHLIEVLAADFRIYTGGAVRGKHPYGKGVKKVDLIISPLDLTPWKDDKVFFGIEIKNPANLTHTNILTKWKGQCQDYAMCDWKVSPDGGETWTQLGPIQIFTCPSLIASIPGSDVLGRYNNAWLSREMAQQGIGELKPMDGRGWSLVRNGDHVIWSQKKGVEDGRKDSVQRRFGSR